MTITDPSRDIVSIGCLASQIQRPVRTIERAARELGIEPALRLNNVPHFDGEQVERIRLTLFCEAAR